jgi:hypothetical protein
MIYYDMQLQGDLTTLLNERFTKRDFEIRFVVSVSERTSQRQFNDNSTAYVNGNSTSWHMPVLLPMILMCHDTLDDNQWFS